MVSTLRRNGKVSQEQVEAHTPDEEQEQDEQEEQQSEPVNWIYKTAVAVKNLPLSPEVLDGETHYETKKGNITILDPKYAAYRVGNLLADLGFTVADIGSEDLTNFIEDSLNYYTVEYPKEISAITAERNAGKAEQVAASAIKQLKKMSAIMGLGRESWTDDQWLAFIKDHS